MSDYGAEGIGDNIEFTASNIDDYTIWFSKSGTDDATNKYPNNPRTARKFAIRTDKTVDIVSINGITLTNPITVLLNTSHIETRNVPVIFKMVIRTASTNTALKIRWF